MCRILGFVVVNSGTKCNFWAEEVIMIWLNTKAKWMEFFLRLVIFIFCHSFIHSDQFYSASSSPLLLRGAPDTARILCQNFPSKRHGQLQVKDLPKVPTWRVEWSLNPWPFGQKALTLPMRHTRPLCLFLLFFSYLTLLPFILILTNIFHIFPFLFFFVLEHFVNCNCVSLQLWYSIFSFHQ